MARTCVVIGAGPGGSACAALLQSKGLKVTLLEQNTFIGGKCSTFEDQGFKFDSGIHMFATGPKGPHGQVARELGVPQEWLIRDPSEAIRLNDKGFFYLHQKTNSRKALGELVSAAISGRQRIDILNTFYRSVKSFGVAGFIRELAGVAKAYPSFVQKYDDMTTRDFLYLFTDDLTVHRSLNCLSMLLLVVPYTKSSAGEFMYVVSDIFRRGTLGVPRGGAASVPLSFMRAFLRDGGKLCLGVRAEKIIVEDGKAKAVLGTDGNTYPADVVVSNAGLNTTVMLAGEENFPEEYVNYIKSLELSYSWIATKFALKKRVIDLRAPSFFPIPELDPERIFAYCDEPDGIPEDPFLFVPIPTEWDKTVAPPGYQLVLCGVPTSREVDQEERSRKILDVAEEKLFSFFPEMKKHVVYKKRITNKDTNKITRKGTGECIGLAQIPGQVGVNKPNPKMPVKNLWIVGCDAGARGVGTEQAVASAMLVSNLIL